MEISIMGAICFASLYEPVHQRFATNIDFGRIANIQPQAFGKAVARLVEERVDEQNHKLRIERIAKVVNSTSLKVAAQYETAPYPRWTRLGMSLREGELRRGLEAYFRAAQLAFMDHPFDVLVAGCGTGMDAVDYPTRSNITALRKDPTYPGAGCSDAQLRAFRHLLLTDQPGNSAVN
jgi:hypothetical protein